MHVEPWKLELLLFVLTWWPAILLALLALAGYGVWRLVRRMRRPRQHCPACKFTLSGMSYCVNCGWNK